MTSLFSAALKSLGITAIFLLGWSAHSLTLPTVKAFVNGASTCNTVHRSLHHSRPMATPLQRVPTATAVLPGQGTTFRDGIWALQITQVATADVVTSTYSTADTAKGKYILLNVTATNKGNVPGALFLAPSFVVIDAQGRQFAEATAAEGDAATNAGIADHMAQVQPTFSESTVLVFDVAAASRSFTLADSSSFIAPPTPLAHIVL